FFHSDRFLIAMTLVSSRERRPSFSLEFVEIFRSRVASFNETSTAFTSAQFVTPPASTKLGVSTSLYLMFMSTTPGAISILEKLLPVESSLAINKERPPSDSRPVSPIFQASDSNLATTVFDPYGPLFPFTSHDFFPSSLIGPNP